MSLSPGQRIDRYEVEALLGSGGMGTVYRARDPKLDRSVAIKTLPNELVAQDEHLKRFDREARCTSSLNHPNVVSIHDVGSHDGLPFIVMEHVQGVTFHQLVDEEGPLDVEKAVGLTIQAARGLSKAHSVGIVHRDVKPANLMLTTDGVVKVLDFGLAKLFESCQPPGELSTTGAQPSELTGAHRLVGTPQYMSPEQVRRLPLDHRTDLWSLGAVLAFLLTGTAPFQAATLVDILYAVAHDEPDVLTSDGIDRHVQCILRKALTKEPARRHASAEDFIADLTHPSGAYAEGRVVENKRSQLPARLTSFVGRQREIERARSILESTRLLSLTGPGGSGKTSLAVESARSLGDAFADGARFVSLAAVTTAPAFWRALARSLGVDAEADDPKAEVTEFLGDRNLLLVLDNFEQLALQSPMVTELLENGARLQILVTTRVPLRVRGEVVLEVPPLTLPDREATEDQILESDAVRLFLQRSRAVVPTLDETAEVLQAVAEIVRRLDGLPLALELAAARTRLLSPKALLKRLEKRLDVLTGGGRDAPERHQTLRAAIEWSYELLNDPEKLLFRRLSGFAGGVTLEAAEAVVTDLGGDPDAVLDDVASLLDKSLLRREEQPNGEPRLFLLETIREFGVDRSEAHGETKGFRDAHARYFMEVAEFAAPKLTGPKASEWLDRVSQEYENMRQALHWLETCPEPEDAGLRLSVALWRYWLARGPLAEGRDFLQSALAKAPVDEHRELRAQALTAAGSLTQNTGDFASAMRMLEESLSIQREIATPERTAGTLLHLGWVYWRFGDFQRATELTEEGLAIHRQCGNEIGVTTALNSLGVTAVYRGEYIEARRILEEVVERFHEHGDARRESFALTNLGMAAHYLGETTEGERLVKEAVEMSGEITDLQYHGYALKCRAEIAIDLGEFDFAARLLKDEALPRAERIGEVSVARILSAIATAELELGHTDEAETLFRDCLQVRRRIGDKWGVAEVWIGMGRLGRRQGRVAAAAAAFQESLAPNQEMANMQGLIDALEGLGGLGVDVGDAPFAARLFAAASAVRARTGAAIPPRLRGHYDADIERVTQALGPREMESLTQEGRDLDVARAVELARTKNLREA